ncbi:MAG: YgfZ/GcvT domain-containing protein [Gaiellaceae bacterium]
MIATDEYGRLREAVGMVDRSDRGKALFRGPDAADFLQGQVTNDVEGLAPGAGCYAALLTPKGKMLADMRILRGDGWFWLDTELEALPAVAKMIRTYSIGRDVRPENVTDSRAILSLVGPGSDAALDVAPPAGEHSHVEGEHGLYVRTDLGVDVICEVAPGEEGVRAALGVEEVSGEAAECLRVESGRPRYGIDLGEDTIPQEAGLNERAVSFTKGCYVGQETVARLHYKGKPNRHLRGLRLSAPASTGDEVRLGDRVVGRVGSAAVSPEHGPIALATIRREAAPGDQVQVGSGETTAVVSDLPF